MQRRRLRLTQFLTLALVALAVVSEHSFSEGSFLDPLYETLGYVLLLVAAMGRVWCSAFIAGKKSRELVRVGPYSIVRNPLYVFSFIGAAGIGAQTGSVVIALICTVVCYIVFAVLVRREEAALVKVHGETYAAYLRSTPRFLPNPSLWWDRDSLTVQPVRVMRTFADGLVFLLAIPVAEGLEYLQSIHVLPVLANLP